MENEPKPTSVEGPEPTPEETALKEKDLAISEGGQAYEDGIVIPLPTPESLKEELKELEEHILDESTTDEDRLKFQDRVNKINKYLAEEESVTEAA